MKDELLPVAIEAIQARILVIRGKKVLLDRDLALLYGVPTGNLNRAVIRNIKRFPDDFMFQLEVHEFENLICQNGISSWGGARRLPRAFTEQGIAMLSGILQSDRAIEDNIMIMRAFVQMRELVLTYTGLEEKIKELEKKYDYKFSIVFQALRELAAPPQPPRRPIGFRPE